ncbi:MAG: hypothetical protein QXK88_08460 [Desulfurococcaceae archaeon]
MLIASKQNMLSGGKEEKAGKIKIIYYAHPIETYGTCVENFTEELARKQFGKIYHICDWSQLYRAIGKDAREKLRNLFSKMGELVRQYKSKIPETDAESIAHEFMRAFKSGVVVDHDILFNPKTFSDVLLIGVRSEMFKKKAFPHFCYGLIDYCDIIVAHGYIMNDNIKRLFLDYLTPSTSNEEVAEYCREIRNLIAEAEGILWSPGTLSEVKYALEKGKTVFVLRGTKLRKVKIEDVSRFKEVPFDNYGLRLYNEIWQPTAKRVYRTLTPHSLFKQSESKPT